MSAWCNLRHRCNPSVRVCVCVTDLLPQATTTELLSEYFAQVYTVAVCDITLPPSFLPLSQSFTLNNPSLSLSLSSPPPPSSTIPPHWPTFTLLAHFHKPLHNTKQLFTAQRWAGKKGDKWERVQEIGRGGGVCGRRWGKDNALRSTVVFSGMSPCFGWLAWRQRWKPFWWTLSVCLWSAACTRVHPSSSYLKPRCRNKPVFLHMRSAEDAFKFCQRI